MIARVFYSLQFEKDFETYAFANQINVFFSISFEKVFRFVRQHHIYFILFIWSTIFSAIVRASFSLQFEIFDENIFVCKSNRRVFFFFVQKIFQFDFNSLVMNSTIFLFFCDNRTSNLFSLKTLFTYDERLATLKFCLKFLETSRHFKTIMIVVDFSKNDNSNFNVMQCIICSLLIYNEYFTFESLKKYFYNVSHCSFIIQFQQEVESKKIVEKSKIEFLFAFASSWKRRKSRTYEKKLTSLKNSHWFSNYYNKKMMIVVEYDIFDISNYAKCVHCWYWFLQSDCEKSLKKHFRKSFDCLFALQNVKKIFEVKKLIEFEKLKISKLIFVVVDIEYFDSTFLCDIQKFDLHHEITNFCQHLQSIRINYRENELISFLFECFRNSALIWYRQQQNENEIVKNLNEWLEVLIIAFFAKFSKFEIFTSNSFVFRFSFQYHFCLNCFAFFSSLIRLLQHIQKIVCKKIICKHCEKVFESNNKFHEHFRQHHAKKMIKVVSKRNFNREKN